MTAPSSLARNRLTQLATALRHFHSALLEYTKSEYEFREGPVGGPFALYSLVMNHPSFQWLRPLSGLMATLDEVLDSKERLGERHLQDVRSALGALMGGLDPHFAEFRAGYARAAADPAVRAAEARWREVLEGLEA
ncbi:hypothetical protein [Deinococcus sp.]|uniref:hypothetical protein n=1 Tax=Deinococcus sp. TaxID=47478 RepID=UPI003CC5C3A5